MKTVKNEAITAADTSIKFVSVQVPEAIVSKIKDKVNEYQVQRRSDQNYIEALHRAVVLPNSFYAADYSDDDNEGIKAQTSASYFANFDELIEVYKDQSALPKTLINQLLTSFADVVLKNEGDESGCMAGDESFDMFINEFYERIGILTGCNDCGEIRP